MNSPIQLIPLHGKYIGYMNTNEAGTPIQAMPLIALASVMDTGGEVTIRYVAANGTGMPIYLPGNASVQRID